MPWEKLQHGANFAENQKVKNVVADLSTHYYYRIKKNFSTTNQQILFSETIQVPLQKTLQYKKNGYLSARLALTLLHQSQKPQRMIPLALPYPLTPLP